MQCQMKYDVPSLRPVLLSSYITTILNLRKSPESNLKYHKLKDRYGSQRLIGLLSKQTFDEYELFFTLIYIIKKKTCKGYSITYPRI